MKKLSDDEVRLRLKAAPGWQKVRGELKSTYVLRDFVKALRFVNRVGRMAEEAAHHPDIAISWNRVTLTLSTHSEGGITEADFSLAKKIEAAAPKGSRHA